MGLFAIAKKEFGVGIADPPALKLKQYIAESEAALRLDWTQRVNGDGVYSGYKTLRDFYKGQQWSYRKEGGGSMRTYNYVFTIVENMTAFLTNEPPQMSCPPTDQSDAVQRKLAEGRTKILNAVHEDNAVGLVFQRAVRTGSITGDTFIFGPIPTFKTDDNGVKTFESIRYWNVERPEDVRIIWKDNNYTEIDGFIKHYRIAVVTAKRLFAEQIKNADLVVQEDRDPEDPNPPKTNVPMITIKEYWGENEYLLLFNNDNKVVDYIKHDWGYVPIHFVPNIHLPGEPKGTSDIENELDPQQEYNERACDLADIIKEISKPSYWGKNLDNLTEVRSGQIVIYQVGDDGDIQAMPKSGNTMPTENYLQDRKNDIIALSGMNQVLYPGSQVMQATGRALSVVMQGVNNKIALRKEWWVKAFKDINRGILFHAETWVPDAKKIIDGNYKTDVFISSVLLRSVADEISKFQAKVQSQTTTMHNVGIDNPSEEQKLMKEELEDSILSVEISKQPGLLHSILAERLAAAQQTNPGYVPGESATSSIAAPITSESEDQESGNPASSSGIAPPVSQQGAINQNAQRSGFAPMVKRRK